MRIAMVTTCKGRVQHLRQTLLRNIADNSGYADCVFVVLSYGDRDGLDEFMASPEVMEHIRSGRLVYYRYPEPKSFQMAHAKNVAHRLGIIEGADILVNLDADNITGPGFAEWIAETYEREGNDVFLWAKMVLGKMPRGISGRIVCTRHQFMAAGGYDQQFVTWAPDDKDFNTRLRRIGFRAIEIERQFIDALRHNDRMRFKEYPHAARGKYSDSMEWAMTCDTNVVNDGRMGCAVAYRNFEGWRIVLEPLPTRIFGIGMHKTATSSLDMALSQLGYDTAHWRSAIWAKTIWREMNSTGRSLTLEKHYALTDLPIPMLFRKLDRAYPGSKFILTTTSEEAWIRSAERHWSYRNNPWRPGWDNDAFTNIIHRKLYGRTDFDRETFLDRYRRHNAEVMEYFKYRPGDLLVMPMSEGAGWTELCRFLGRTEPNTPYPRANSYEKEHNGLET
jgi:Sulfotransferase domain/N-terminal domain of galactosyltransferase